MGKNTLNAEAKKCSAKRAGSQKLSKINLKIKCKKKKHKEEKKRVQNAKK